MTHYTPKTEEELAKEGLLTKADYDFEILECIDKPSKKGNPMYTLKLNVFEGNGLGRIIYDYVVFGTSFGERKFRHLAYAVGAGKEYDAGKLEGNMLVGRAGKVTIGIQEGTADYPLPKNSVLDYVYDKPKPVPVDLGDENSIPF